MSRFSILRAVEECNDWWRECRDAAWRLCRTAAECSWALRRSSATLELLGSVSVEGELCAARDPREEDWEAKQAKEGAAWVAKDANVGVCDAKETRDAEERSLVGEANEDIGGVVWEAKEDKGLLRLDANEGFTGQHEQSPGNPRSYKKQFLNIYIF